MPLFEPEQCPGKLPIPFLFFRLQLTPTPITWLWPRLTWLWLWLLLKVRDWDQSQLDLAADGKVSGGYSYLQLYCWTASKLCRFLCQLLDLFLGFGDLLNSFKLVFFIFIDLIIGNYESGIFFSLRWLLASLFLELAILGINFLPVRIKQKRVFFRAPRS